MSFKEAIENIETRPDYPDMIWVWRHGTGWPIAKDDLDAFCVHMDDWYSICYKDLSRSEYEQACKDRGIVPVPDEDIGGYGEEYGDFGMYHYHTNPENRLCCIRSALKQCRWFGMKLENPNIVQERQQVERVRLEAERIKELRKTYPDNLQAWIKAVGGLEAIYQGAVKLHAGNPVQLRDEGRHFEWLIGHTCNQLGMKASETCPGYVAGDWKKSGVYPLHPVWWGGWTETDPIHPINQIAGMLAGRRIEPYQGLVTYHGYGEDCGDDVRKNLQEWLGV